MSIANSFEWEYLGVQMRSQLASFDQLRSLLQDCSMVFASDVAGKRQEHEDDVEGEGTHMYMREVMSGTSCYGDDGATDLGGFEGIV